MLLQGERLGEQVAQPLHPGRHLVDVEGERLTLGADGHLVPTDRCGHRRPVSGSGGIGCDRRFVAAVLRPVDQHLVVSLGLGHLGEHPLGLALGQQLAHGEGEAGRVVVVVGCVQRHVHLQALGPRRLGERDQVDRLKDLPKPERHLAAAGQVDAGPGIEVEHQHGWGVELAAERHVGV